MDKPWAERAVGVPWEDKDGTEAKNMKPREKDGFIWRSGSEYVIREGLPQARISYEGSSQAWSAAWGAVFGAGAVLVIVAALLLWRRPRKNNGPQLAPMDVGRNITYTGSTQKADTKR